MLHRRARRFQRIVQHHTSPEETWLSLFIFASLFFQSACFHFQSVLLMKISQSFFPLSVLPSSFLRGPQREMQSTNNYLRIFSSSPSSSTTTTTTVTTTDSNSSRGDRPWPCSGEVRTVVLYGGETSHTRYVYGILFHVHLSAPYNLAGVQERTLQAGDDVCYVQMRPIPTVKQLSFALAQRASDLLSNHRVATASSRCFWLLLP